MAASCSGVGSGAGGATSGGAGDGTGGESAWGGEFADEINPQSELYRAGYRRGIVAMANAGPNTNGSQFFLVYKDSQLPPNYTVFGTIDAISSAGFSVSVRIGRCAIHSTNSTVFSNVPILAEFLSRSVV